MKNIWTGLSLRIVVSFLTMPVNFTFLPNCLMDDLDFSYEFKTHWSNLNLEFGSFTGLVFNG